MDPRQSLTNLTDAQKEVVYTYLTQTLVSCLEDHGYAIRDIPSRASFMAGYEQSPPFNPYLQILDQITTIAGTEELQTACPPNTPLKLIYGD